MNRSSTKILSLKPEEKKREEGKNKPKIQLFRQKKVIEKKKKKKPTRIRVHIVLIARVAVGFEVDLWTYRVRDVKD